METIRRYIEQYPNDKVVLIGGAAAHIIVETCLSKSLPVKDVDVHISTSEEPGTVLERFKLLFPGYTAEYEKDCPLDMFTLSNPGNISVDVFINQKDFPHTVPIGAFCVERLDLTIDELSHEVEGRKSDLFFISDPDEKQYTLDKLDRLTTRLKMLETCSIALNNVLAVYWIVRIKQYREYDKYDR